MDIDKARQIRELTTEELIWVSGGQRPTLKEFPLPTSTGPTNPNEPASLGR